MTAVGGSWTDLMSDETDIDTMNLSMPLDDIVNPASGGKGSTKRSSNYTQQEDIQLCMSWKNISTDPVVANEQLDTTNSSFIANKK